MISRRPAHGFTLVELIIFIVVVGIGVTAILSVFSTDVKASADPLVRKQAVAIAESLLEEILLKEYKDPNGGTNGVSTCTAGAGSDRALWTNVCEYNTYTSVGIKDVQGNAVPSLSPPNGTYSVLPAVAVNTVTISGTTIKQVVVNVTDPQSNVVTLIGYRGNY